VNLSDDTLVRLGRAIVVVAVLFAVAGVAVTSAWEPVMLVDDFIVESAMIAVGFGAFAWVALPHQSRNAAVWFALGGAFFGGLYAISDGVLIAALTEAGIDSSALPDDMTVKEVMSVVHGVAAPSSAISGGAGPASVTLVIAGLAYFPNGRLLSPRWRWLVRFALLLLVIISAGLMWAFWPTSQMPVSADESEFTGLGRVVEPGSLLLTLAAAGAISSLFIRSRRSDEIERRQLRWIMWGGAALVASLAWSLTANTDIPIIVGLAILIGSYGVAITKYRLYDVDIVISKTFVYGALAAFIGAVYVAVVVGIGTAVGSGSDPNAALALAATAIVAIAFQPLRARLQRLANRIVYGKRATPYEVLSDFSRQVAATDESLLHAVAKSLAQGTAATAASVWVLSDGLLRRLSAWPETEGEAAPVPIADPAEMSVAGSDVVLPIVEGGELLGALALSTPAGQELNRQDVELVQELTSGVGLALRNMRLTADLESRVLELRDSRRRIVALQDETRRSLERDLHDGAQQRLVALKVKLGLAGQVARRDGAERTAEFLSELAGQADEAITELRDFARGIYPPLLEAEGLVAALRSEAARLPVVVDVSAEHVDRYPKSLEATVYFCVLEALHNVSAHSGARSAQVRLHDDGGVLRFEVRDAGSGFDREEVRTGRGIANMVDRVDAAGGTLTIKSMTGSGTTVTGSIPLDGAGP
jgi:signal transduction histidine kinase